MQQSTHDDDRPPTWLFEEVRRISIVVPYEIEAEDEDAAWEKAAEASAEASVYAVCAINEVGIGNRVISTEIVHHDFDLVLVRAGLRR